MLPAVDPVVRIALGLGLSWVLIDAALHKLRHPLHFGAVIDQYRLLPTGAGAWLVRPLGAFELCTGCALLLPFAHRAGALLAALLLTLYFLAMALNLWRGRREIDCGCGAPGNEQQLSGALLARNVLLASAALWLALAASVSRQAIWMDWVVGLSAAAILLLLYATVNLLLANRQLLR
jgi:uncharacterized membrane protein YphA (DoxX/SURF4 family)